MSEVEWLNIFADNLLHLMVDRRMSQYELADMTGLSQATISKYIRKQQMPGVKALINLAYVLNCSLDELMDYGCKVR